jgi:cation transport regulator
MSKSKGQGKKRRRIARSTTTSSSRRNIKGKDKDKQISARTKKQIDSLPEHAQHIYKKAHASAIDQYQSPEKRRGGKRQSAEEVTHKTAWAAVKREYKKKGNQWVKKEEEE